MEKTEIKQYDLVKYSLTVEKRDEKISCEKKRVEDSI